VLQKNGATMPFAFGGWDGDRKKVVLGNTKKKKL
jgi:hypothetical protein